MRLSSKSLLNAAGRNASERPDGSGIRVTAPARRGRVTPSKAGWWPCPNLPIAPTERSTADDGVGRPLRAARQGRRRGYERRLARPRPRARPRGRDQDAALVGRARSGTVAPLPPRSARACGARARAHRSHLRLHIERRAVVPGHGVCRRCQPRADDAWPAPARDRRGRRLHETGRAGARLRTRKRSCAP